MALIVKDRVKETSTTTGTGPYTLNGAATGFRTFGSVCAVSDTFYGIMEAVNGSGVPTGDWMTGLFTYSGTNQITLTTFSDSSTGSAISFSAGTINVALSLVASAIGKSVTARSASGLLTRVLSVASGNVATTGIGFKPRKLTVYVGVNGTTYGSIGTYSNGVYIVNYRTSTNTWYVDNTIVAAALADFTNYQTATVASLDADGFTLGWVKTGSPTATANLAYFAEE